MTSLVQEPTFGMRLRAVGRRLLMSEYLILYLCIALFAVMFLIEPKVASPYNITNLLSNIWPLLVVAIGQTLAVPYMAAGGIGLGFGLITGMKYGLGAVTRISAPEGQD